VATPAGPFPHDNGDEQRNMATKQVIKPAELPNRDGLSKDHLNALIKYLGRLEGVDESLAAHSIRYVVDGGDEEVLLRLGGVKEAAEVLRLGSTSHVNWQQLRSAAEERAVLWRPDANVAPGVRGRLAQVFAAARRAAGVTPQTPDGWPEWLVTLVGELIEAWHMTGRDKGRTAWPLPELEAVLRSADLPTELIARGFLSELAARTFRSSGNYWHGDPISPFRDWAPYLARHVDAVREALAVTAADHRLYVLRTLNQMGFDFAPVVDLLVDLGTGPAKTVREAALPVLHGCRDQARPLIERVLAEGDAALRHEAVLLLWRLFGREAADSLRQHLGSESSERVRQTVDKLLAAPDEAPEDVTRDLAAALPPVRIELGEVDLPDEAKAGLREHVNRGYEQTLHQYERDLERWESPDRPKWMREPGKPEPVSDDQLGALVRFVEGRAEKPEREAAPILLYARRAGPLGEWLAPPRVKLIHVVRLYHALALLNFHQRGETPYLWWRETQSLDAYRRRCAEPFGLREVDAAVTSLPGARPGLVASAYLADNTRYSSFCDWEAQAVWPIFAEHPEMLQEGLSPAASRPGDYWPGQRRETAFKVLSMFPQLPPGFIPPLWDIALGENKTERPLAQAALAKVPDKAPRIQVALADGRQAVRAAAAEWLGKIGDPSAVGPLKEAFTREKQEVVKGALLNALEALGADIAEFLDRDALLAEAEAGLAKKRPKGLGWLPLASLPPLQWEDTGERVDPLVVQWWVVQSVQQKSAVCGPLLRRYLGLCRRHEATALAKFLLASWIGQDTRTLSHEEAAERARKDADRQWAAYSQHQYWLDHYKGDKENLYRQLYTTYANACIGSASGEKGMLALVAPAADAECVKLCDQYIRKWFGNRLAQCKALIEVLAWTPHPLAVQVLLGFANRFRTKAIRKAAEEYVQALAEREGWTIDELADRTIPDAGFARPTDEQGEPVGGEAALVLDYGPRTFTVRLNNELEPVIATGEGKTVKNLPAAGKQDDADKAKAARKTFSDAKKTVKEVVRRQSERLYEALCTQRSWRFGDWRRYLADHPIAGRLCVRLAWAAFAPAGAEGAERFLGCFRPLEDGSLTNQRDEEVTLPDETLVRLAHTCNTPAEVGAAWVKHFEDYDVAPLFQQLGRATYTLPEEKRKETDLTDFEGYLLTTFQLRGKATKLGYIRGEAEDGGCFFVYRKPFPSLGVQAVLSFTGSMLPEQDVAAALEALYFTSIKGDREAESSWQPSKLPLGKVPPVLLSECYNDVRQIAAEGSGYDPKWRDKSYF
jgi:HEAT repeat protein